MEKNPKHITAEQDTIEWLSGQSVLEIAKLVKDLEEKWGVSAAAPVAVAAAPVSTRTPYPTKPKPKTEHLKLQRERLVGILLSRLLLELGVHDIPVNLAENKFDALFSKAIERKAQSLVAEINQNITDANGIFERIETNLKTLER